MSGKYVLHPVMQICPVFVHVLRRMASFPLVFSGAFWGKPMVVVARWWELGFEIYCSIGP